MWHRNVIGVLKMVRRDERLAFPQYRLDVEVEGELTIKPSDELFGLQPLRPHIGR
jgi:hypothetical protein